MVDSTLDLVRAAASHPLLGDTSLVDGSATGGSTTTLIDGTLITTAQDQTYKGRWLYLWSATNAIAGSERYVSAVAGDTGTLTFGSILSAAVSAGDNYLLFRDHRWSDWLRFLNDAARNLYFDRQIYLRGQTDLLRYTLPTPLSQPGWIEAAFIGDYPFAFSTDYPHPEPAAWFRLDPLNVQGDLYLLLDESIAADQQLVFKARVPYLFPSLSAYTMTRSVLVPFGETTAVSIPRELLVLGAVWRALVQKERPLTGDARKIWTVNRMEAARQYAAQLARAGVWAAGREQGYSSVW